MNTSIVSKPQANDCIITKDYVQFVFEVDTGAKRTGTTAVGVDTGINALATLSTGEQLGTDIKQLIEKIKRCEHGSQGQKRAKRALRQRIDEVAKIVTSKSDLVVVEALKKMGFNGKLKRRLSKNMRRSIGTWNWRYWLMRLEMDCEWNRVSFRSVAPQYTSQQCHACGYTDRGNRVGEVFCCLKCSHRNNADVNAFQNILGRFLTGPYGAGYKPLVLQSSN